VAPDAREEWFLYQTMAGVWPHDEAELPTVRQRLKDYMVKAAREAKVNTTWTEPNAAHERGLVEFVDAVLDDETFVASFRAQLGPVMRGGAVNSLAQVALKIGVPGVPDVYQGTETWAFLLVDPDNRRPVDWAEKRRVLQRLGDEPPSEAQASRLLDDWRDGAVKMHLLRTGLRWRRENRRWADAAYVPLESDGPRRRNVFAFLRRDGDRWALVAVPRLVASRVDERLRFPDGFWDGTTVRLPAEAPRAWRSMVTDAAMDAAAEDRIGAGELFRTFPVALAVAER